MISALSIYLNPVKNWNRLDKCWVRPEPQHDVTRRLGHCIIATLWHIISYHGTGWLYCCTLFEMISRLTISGPQPILHLQLLGNSNSPSNLVPILALKNHSHAIEPAAKHGPSKFPSNHSRALTPIWQIANPPTCCTNLNEWDVMFLH